jgi:hypothetical protein
MSHLKEIRGTKSKGTTDNLSRRLRDKAFNQNAHGHLGDGTAPQAHRLCDRAEIRITERSDSNSS